MLSKKNQLLNNYKNRPAPVGLPKAPADRCFECNDTGYVSYEGKNGYSCCRPCDCIYKKTKRMLFGENYVDKNFENYEGRSLTMTKAKEYLSKNPVGSYLISGKVGLGKTHLLAGLYEALCKRFFGKIFNKKELDLLEYLKAGSKWLDDFKDTDYQVVQIDDLGKVDLAKWDVERFFRFYDYISSNKIYLQITTNMTAEEIGKAYGSAITDRLFRNNKCEIIYIKEADLSDEGLK